ncbi:MAG TPA: hypothetical protein VIR29_09755 [Anseongella sp.]
MFKLSKILPLLAIVAGFAGSAFTSAQEDAVEAAQTDLYWYTPDGTEFIVFGPEPGTGCGPGQGCAKGYDEEQPLPVSEEVEPTATRAFN